MNNQRLKKALPYILAIVIFFFISLFTFPAQIKGEKLAQHDKKTWMGGAHEIEQFQKETGEHSFWTNSMFGGMPTYLVTNYAPSNVAKVFYKIIDLGHRLRPASFIFMLLVGFFIALLLFGLDPWLSIAGALAFAFSSYFFIIIGAGHITKVIAIAFSTPIIAGIYHAYRKNMLVGSIVMTIFLAMQLLVNHLQITYYTLLVILIYIIFEFIHTVKEKTYKNFFKVSAFLFISAIIAASTNFSQIITTYDYGKDSIRGKSELTDNQHNKTSGLDKDYATAWSYGKLETLDLLVPNLMGGASTGSLTTDSQTYQTLRNMGVPNARSIIKNLPLYWGPQPFTSGPVYIGALVIFLFLMGMFLVKGDIKWWLFTTTVFAILLAWGKYFMPLTNLFLDYFPMYNKFRTVSMILVIAEITIPLLGFLALKEIINGKADKKEIFKAMKYSLAISVGVILFLLIPGVLSFRSANDAQIFAKWPKQLVNSLIQDRGAMFRADAFRSILFILIGAVAIWAFVKKYIKKEYFIAIIGLGVLLDLAPVDSRYLNKNNFVPASKAKVPFIASQADNYILKDKDKDFRVLNLSVSPFNDASTSYFHKSIGGYSGAKLRRYQDFIDHVLQNDLSILITSLQQKNIDQQKINQTLSKLTGLNMLNTKYIIINPKAMPLYDPYRLGNAWFVEKIEPVNNADQEIAAVANNFDPKKTAVVDIRFKKDFFKFSLDTTAQIVLTDYKPNYLSYQTQAQSPQLAVFSEIYYADGWQAYIDGKPVPHFRADYILRAMKIPAGKHTIEFKFQPRIWKIGNTISIIGSVIFIIFILGGLYFIIKSMKTEEKKEKK